MAAPFHLSRNRQTVFHFPLPQVGCESSDVSTSLPTPIFCFFDNLHPSGCEVVSHCGFHLHFSDDSDAVNVLTGHLRIIIGGVFTLEINMFIILVVSPDSSVGKESICNAGDPGSIPALGRYPGEGNG